MQCSALCIDRVPKSIQRNLRDTQVLTTGCTITLAKRQVRQIIPGRGTVKAVPAVDGVYVTTRLGFVAAIAGDRLERNIVLVPGERQSVPVGVWTSSAA